MSWGLTIQRLKKMIPGRLDKELGEGKSKDGGDGNKNMDV